MNEEKRINEVVEEYKSIFDNTDCDIARSRKGIWIFMRLDEEYGYHTFTRFKTADELRLIIQGEMADDINMVIEGVGDELQHIKYDNAEERKLSRFPEMIDELYQNMDRVALYFEEFSGSLKGLQELLKGKK